MKPDALSPQFLRGEEAAARPETILQAPCVVATLMWDIEERVRATTEDQPGLSACPDNRLVCPQRTLS